MPRSLLWGHREFPARVRVAPILPVASELLPCLLRRDLSRFPAVLDGLTGCDITSAALRDGGAQVLH